MIDNKTIARSSDIVDNVRYSGKKLVTKPGSHLGLIVDTLVSFDQTGDDNELRDQSIFAGTTVGTHTEKEEYVSSKIAKIICNIIDEAKNLVNPYCKQIIERIDEVRKNNKLSEVGLLGEIKQVNLPDLFKDDMFNELIAPYKTVAPSVITNSAAVLKRISTDFTLEEQSLLVKTGSKLLDNKIDSYIGNSFSNFDYYRDIDTAEINLFDSTRVFLLMVGIQNEKLEKATAIMEDPEYTLAVTQLKAATAGKIYREIESYDSSVKRGDVVTTHDPFHPYSGTPSGYKQLVVHGKNYRNWLETKNGTPEAAMGFLAVHGDSNPSLHSSKLTGNSEYYLSEYERRLEFIKSKEMLEDIALVRKVTAQTLSDIIFGLDAEVDKPYFQARLQKALEAEYHSANSVYSYVVKIVTRTFCEGHEVKNFLTDMDGILEKMEQPSHEYAAFIATNKLIARWISCHLDVLPN